MINSKETTRIGFYPGTFDPITNGHLDIIKRAVGLVDKLIIGVALNENKSPLWSLEERVECIHAALVEEFGEDYRILGNGECAIKVVGFGNLLVDCVKEHNASVIIRGLRQATDFDMEFQMCLMNQRLAPDIETIFLVATEQNRSIASSVVKEVARLGGDISSFVPKTTLNKLRQSI
ncbi:MULTISPECIES: pantetheine-phosphate adenylyltransferase [Commensalibacter]|uniref:Phosphopantetheine adenylyltransferase n=2 Tax=Commensalibacter TaxID=1079922 RepID=W7DWC1_9PROT|nr:MULTISPECIES: pantetheine-phosphate adenylyltransferase [Commensalibacter]EUK18518.1 pantetheine-phosphate adenylyltransferase [Commensalibacter papalotli (ex Servin-Garciduenas et al. 2014)]CAI3932391.1 Phosphopantetheine adenylyltransferase (CoaD) (PDB:3F3M) [Commensalibacter papalotli (ex Botero et al. 2024)]CAI3943266.1 Phosphopantetheine adenylyltransferase (CoaD) (PDB:3F3M) [Commensalibacter papalotli (ex Botero et al. 2024)]